MTTRQDRVETVEQILYGSTLPTRVVKAYAARIIEALDDVTKVTVNYSQLSDVQKRAIAEMINNNDGHFYIS